MQKKLILFLACYLLSNFSYAQTIFTESFDAGTTPTGWNNSSVSGGPWAFSTSAGYDVSSLPEHTGNNGNYAWLDFSGTDDSVILVTPSIDVSSLTTPYLEFYHESHYSGSLTPFNSLHVEAWNGTAWINVVSLQGNTPLGWDQYGYDMSNFTFANGDSLKVRFHAESGGSSNDFYNDLLLDDIAVMQMPSCPNPISSSLNASNLSSTTADLSWTEAGTATSWLIEYGTQGFTLGMGTAIVTGTNPYNLTGLTGNTDYSFYVRAICAAGDSSTWVGPFNFTTLCGTYTPAYSQDFTTYLDPCWAEASGTLSTSTTLTGTTSSWAADGFANNGSTGAARINLFGASADEWLISPSIDLGNGATSYQLEFDIALTDWGSSAATNLGADDTIAVVISTDNGVTWEKANILQLWVAGSEPNHTGDHIVINLTAYTGVVKFGFYTASTVSNEDNDVFVDNFLVTNLASCPSPNALTATNITAATADLGWTENGSATSWSIEYGTQGFTQGTGTIVVTGTNPHNLTGLTANTNYQFYVRAICGAGDSSSWVGPFNFVTPCPASYTPTYLQDFATFLDACWSEAQGTLSTSTILTGTTSNWAADGFANNGSTGAAKINLYGTGRDEWLLSPSIDLGNGTTPYQLEFDIALTDFGNSSATTLGADDTIAVVISTDNGATWEKANMLQHWVAGSEPSHTGDHIVISLASYTGVVKFGFYAASSVSNADNDVFVDNFLVTNLANCAAPNALTATNISSTTADLGWTENGSATSWSLEYGPQGFAQGAGTTVVTGTNPHNLTGLTANTDYSFYVRAICGAGDSSSWAGPFNFTTPCGAYTPTYLQDFTNYVPACWSEAEGVLSTSTTLTGTSSNWTSDGFANNGSTGAAKINLYGTGRDEWLISPSIDLGNGTTPYQLEFDIALTDWNNTSATTLGSDDTIAVVISTDNGATWEKANMLQHWVAGSEPSNTGNHVVISLAAYTGVVKFGFYAASSLSNADNDVFVDNFLVTNLANCPAPNALTATNVSATTADLGWTENGSATSWSLEYGPQGFAQGAGTTVVTGTNPYSLTGLTANTDYSFYVRAICGAGDSSVWAGPFNFTTPCGAYTPTYLQEFNNYVPACWSEAEGVLNTSTILTGASSNWTSDGFANNGFTGAAKINLYGTGRDEWLISPSIDLGNGATTYQLEFDIALTDYASTSATTLGSDDTIAVVISTDDGATWEKANILQHWVAGSEPSHLGERIVINLGAYTGVVKFGFYAASSLSNADNDVFIDSFLVQVAPIPTDDVAPTAFLNIDSAYCNATSISGAVVISNMISVVTYNIPYEIVVDGVSIATGTIDSLMGNATDTIAIGAIPATSTGITQVQVITNLTSDSDHSNDTLAFRPIWTSYTGVNATVTNPVGCTGNTNGQITAVGHSGFGTYTYLWDAAAGNQATATVTGLAAGSYTVTVTDSIGCAAEATLTLIDPAAMSLAITGMNLNCNGDNSGAATVAVTGGVPSYTYLWSNGQMSDSLMNAAAGTYIVSVTDAYGCIITDSVTLTEPTALTASVVDHGDGTATASATGGVAGYSYQWGPNLSNQTTDTITGLLSNETYYVVVTDANGCTDVVSFQTGVLSTHAISGKTTLNMFPNPTSSNTFVKLNLVEQADVHIKVVNAVGQTVLQKTVGDIQNQTIELNTTALSSGIYVVQFNIGTEQISKKLIISKE